MADYSDLISKYSKQYGVPEKLVRQLINVESSGNAGAVSPTGPVGLMQVSSAVASEAGYKKSDMYDPEKNIHAGVQYLAKNLKAFKGDIPSALLGYNQGTGGARQMLAGKKPMAQEGWNYIHNKKFDPEFLAKGAKIPTPDAIPGQETMGAINAGKEGVAPQEPPKFDQAALMQQATQVPQPQPTQQATPELSDAEKINIFSSKLKSTFNNASTYATQSASSVNRGFLDQWMNDMPSIKNAKALFGGFQ